LPSAIDKYYSWRNRLYDELGSGENGYRIKIIGYRVNMQPELSGASVRNPACGKGHEEAGSAYTKVASSLRSLLGNFRASTPPNQSLPTFCFVFLPTPLTLWGGGGCPPLPLSEKRVNLQLQLIKFWGVIVS